MEGFEIEVDFEGAQGGGGIGRALADIIRGEGDVL
jgi:hypothetical protein